MGKSNPTVTAKITSYFASALINGNRSVKKAACEDEDSEY